MSTTVDERVVSMEFDNRHFEQNVKTSMTTLEKLKKSLNLSGASKGLETVGSAASKQRSMLDELEVTSTRAGFSMRDVWIKTASIFEYQVAGRIISSAKNMISSLTIDPIKTGLKEYETQLNSVQTILANTESKGSTLKDVNAALDELNAYADKTIYNFTEMTRNIGTFTAAGVDLDTSVSAIKGIANLAAVSGSTSQQASTAMYQLSQALSSGTVKLMDWNSVVNAGMGGQVFQDALKETARVHGVAIDDIIKQQGSFRESLSEGWLTSEILTETLAKFTGDLSEEQLKSMGYTEKQIQEIMKLGQTANDAATKVKTFTQLMETLQEAAQSGWAQTWELVFGDFEEAKALWTKISDEIGGVIGKSADNRNKLIAGALNSGWTNFLNEGVADETGFLNYIKGAAVSAEVPMDELIKKYGSLDKAIDASIKDGTITHEMLSKALSDLTAETSTLNEEQLKNLGFTKEQVQELTEFNEKIQNGEASIEDFYKKMQRLSGRELLFNIEYDENGLIKYNERTGALVNIYGALVKLCKAVKEAWRDVFPEATSEGLYKLIDKFREFTSHLVMTDETADKVRRTFKGVFAVLDIVWTVFKALCSIVKTVLGLFKPLIGSVLSLTAGLGDFIDGLRTTLKSAKSIEEVRDTVVKNINNMATKFREFAATLKEKIDTSGLSGFLGFIVGLWNIVKTVFGGIISVISSVGSAIADVFTGGGVGSILDLINALLTGGLIVGIKKILDNIGGIVESFTEILDNVGEAINAFTANIKAKTLESISTSIVLLAAAILVISLIDKDKLERSLAAIAMLFTGLMVAMSFMTGDVFQTAVVKGSSLIALATSLLILAGVLKKLSDISSSDLLKGVLTMTACMAALTGTLAVLAKIKSTRKMATEGAGQLFKISIALLPTVFILKQLADVYWKDLLISFGVMGGALAALVGALAVMAQIKSTKKMALEGAKQLFKISMALIPLAIAFKMLGSMEWEAIGKASVVLAAGLIAMVSALAIVALIDKHSKTINKAKVGDFKMVVGKCAQLTLIAAALGILAITLKVISSMSWGEIAKGLVGVGATLIILLGALKTIAKMEVNSIGKSVLTLVAMSGMMLILSTSLAVFGQMDWDTIGKGLLAMAGTMLILGTALKIMSKYSTTSKKVSARDGLFSSFKMGEKTEIVAQAAALAIFAASIKILASSVAMLGQLSLGQIAKGLIAIVGVLAILGAAGKLLSTSAGTILMISGAVALLGLSCLAAGLGISLMAKTLATFAESVGIAIVAICTTIKDSSKLIAQTIVTLIVDILDGLTQVTDKIVSSLLTIILNSIRSLSNSIPDMAAAFMDLLIGVVDEVINYIPQLEDLLVKLLNSLFDLIGSLFDRIDTDALIKAAMAVGIVAGMFNTLANIKIKTLPKAMLGVVGAVALLAEIVTIFGLLSAIPGVEDFVRSGGPLLEAIGNIIGMLIGGLLSGIAAGFSFNIDTAIEVLQKICSPELVMSLGLISSLVAALNGIGKMKVDFKTFAKTLGELGIMIASVSVLVSIFAGLGAIKGSLEFFKTGIEILTTIASPKVIVALGLLGGLGAALNLLSKFTGGVGSVAKSVATLSIIAGVVLGIVSIFGGIASISGAKEVVSKGVDVLETLGSPKMLLTLAAFTGLMALLGLVAPLALPAIGGVAALMGIITILGLFIMALGGLVQECDVVIPLIESGGNLLQAIGTAIGKFFGGLLDGIAEGVTSSFPAIATNFSDFMTNLQPFFEGCKIINELDILSAVLALSGALLALTATSLITGLVAFLTCGLNFVLLKEQFKSMGEGLVAFSKPLTENNVNLDIIKDGAEAADDLAEACAKIPGYGGLKEFINGAIDLEKFGDGLDDLATGVVEFHRIIKEGNIDKDIVEDGCEAIEILAESVSTLPPMDGWVQKIKGGPDMEQFGAGLASLGAGIVSFQKAISGDGESSVTLNKDTITNGASAIVELAKAVEQIPNTNVFEKLGDLIGRSDEEYFAENLATLGKGVKSFGNEVAGISPEAVAAGGYAALALAEAINKMPEDGNVWSMDMEKLKSKFQGLALAILAFVTGMDLVSEAAIANASSKLTKLNRALESFSTSGIDSIINSFRNSKANIAASVREALEAAVSETETYCDRLKDAGAKLGEKLVSGLKSKQSSIKKQFIEVVTNACDVIEDKEYYNRFREVGSDLVDGFAAGIDENAFKARAAAVAMAEAALEAAREVLKINSPSKAFKELGSYSGEGFIGGLNSYMSNVYSAGYDMGDTAVGALSSSIAKVAQTIENGIDDQITIRPVLDLSEVSNGVNTMKGMLDTSSSIGVMAKVNSISSNMSKNQNRGNSDVVSAIDNLKDTMQTNGGNTYNINGVTYSDGSEVQNAIETIVRAIIRERRV